VIKVEGLIAVAMFCVWIYTLIDVAQTPENEIRNLSKAAWIVIVLFFSVAGVVGWYIFGRPDGGGRRQAAYERPTPSYPEYDRPGRAAAVDPEKDEEFLKGVRARAEEQRKKYEAQKKQEKQDGDSAQ
jgi:Phospholipase_D-nuclease N-terminal